MTQRKMTLKELKEQEKAARKDLIIDAALRLFSSRSLKQVGMRDIAKEAGISPALIYRYFSDQEELFLEALIRENGYMIKRFKEILSEQKALDLEYIANEFIRYLFGHDHFFRMMTHFMMDNPMKPESMEKFNENMRALLEIFDEAFLQSGITETPRIYSHALFAALNGILITYRYYPGRDETEKQKHIYRLTEVIGTLFKSINK